VDDVLVLSLGEDEIFRHYFSGSPAEPTKYCAAVTPEIVDVPREVMQEIAGRTVTIDYWDECLGYVLADATWLLWVPDESP
jgi:hypothetical protein